MASATSTRISTAKSEQAASGGAAKTRQSTPSRYDRRTARRRRAELMAASDFATRIDRPLTVMITVSWDCLLHAGEHNEGHCLWRGAWDRDRYVRTELARLCRTHGLPFVAVWGRDIGHHMGLHMHLGLYWPSHKLAQLVALMERITGSSMQSARSDLRASPMMRSVCRGWQIDRNMDPILVHGARGMAEYIAGQHDKHPTPPPIKGKPFGVSEAIGPAARARRSGTRA